MFLCSFSCNMLNQGCLNMCFSLRQEMGKFSFLLLVIAHLYVITRLMTQISLFLHNVVVNATSANFLEENTFVSAKAYYLFKCVRSSDFHNQKYIIFGVGVREN